MKDDWILINVLLFVLSIWPANILALVLHEAGHAIAARAVGMDVLSFGVGHRKVLLRLPIGGTVFYFGWPFGRGLSTWARRSLDQPAENFWVIAGGLVANIIGLVAGVVALVLEWRSPLLVAWAAVSAGIVLKNAIPRTIRTSGAAIMSDGWRLLQFVRGRRTAVRPSLGVALANARAIIELFAKIGQPAGAAAFHLDASIFEAGLSNLVQARRDLKTATNGAGPRLPLAAQAEAVARLSLASASNDDRLPELARQLRGEFKGVAAIGRAADDALVFWQLKRGISLADLAEAMKRRAIETNRESARAWAAFEVSPEQASDPGARCRQILGANPTMPLPGAVAILTAASAQLAKIGEIDRARVLRDEAHALAYREEGFIQSPETRGVFTKRVMAQLDAIVPGEPLQDEFEQPAAPGAEVAPPRKGKALAVVTMALGIVSMVASAIACAAIATMPFSKGAELAFLLVPAGCFLTTSLTAIGSIVRGERRMGLALTGMALGLAGAIICALVDHHHHSPRPVSTTSDVEQFVVIFCLALWPAEVLAAALHETAHALAGRVVGMSVVAWGVGFGKVLIRIPIRGAIFWLAWPMRGGVTFNLPQSFDASRPAKAFFLAAGLLANLLGLFAALVAWSLGWHGGALAAWAVISFFAFIGSAIPRSVSLGGMPLNTDGKLLLALALNERLEFRLPLGTRLRQVRAAIELLRRIGHPGGVAHYHLYGALLEVALGNVARAREDLKLGAAPEAADLPLAAELTALGQLSIASAAADEQLPSLAEETRTRFSALPKVQYFIDCEVIAWRRARGLPLGDLARNMRDRAAARGNREELTTAAVYEFLADPGDAPGSRCRQILRDHPLMLGITKASVNIAAAGHLAKRGNLDEARQFRQEALAELLREAGSIASPETLQAFTTHWNARLQAILPDEPVDCTPPPASAAPPAIAKAATVALGLGVVALLAGLCAYFWGPMSKGNLANIDFCFLTAGSSFLAILFVGYHSVARGERRIAVVLLGALFGGLGVAASIAAYMNT